MQALPVGRLSPSLVIPTGVDVAMLNVSRLGSQRLVRFSPIQARADFPNLVHRSI